MALWNGDVQSNNVRRPPAPGGTHRCSKGFGDMKSKRYFFLVFFFEMSFIQLGDAL